MCFWCEQCFNFFCFINLLLLRWGKQTTPVREKQSERPDLNSRINLERRKLLITLITSFLLRYHHNNTRGGFPHHHTQTKEEVSWGCHSNQNSHEEWTTARLEVFFIFVTWKRKSLTWKSFSLENEGKPKKITYGQNMTKRKGYHLTHDLIL